MEELSWFLKLTPFDGSLDGVSMGSGKYNCTGVFRWRLFHPCMTFDIFSYSSCIVARFFGLDLLEYPYIGNLDGFMCSSLNGAVNTETVMGFSGGGCILT